MHLNLGLSDVLSLLDLDYAFLARIPKSDYAFLVYHIREVHDTDVSYSWDANLDHLIEVESTGFLHCKVTIFPFAIKKYLEWKYF